MIGFFDSDAGLWVLPAIASSSYRQNFLMILLIFDVGWGNHQTHQAKTNQGDGLFCRCCNDGKSWDGAKRNNCKNKNGFDESVKSEFFCE